MEENKKQIRIGKVTFGVVLILVGIIIFIQTILSLNILRYVLMLWPLVLIILGIEILVYRNKENIKYDIWGSIFTLIIIGIVSLFSIVNYGVNKILYDKDIKSAIINYRAQDEKTLIFNDKVTLNNVESNEKIKIKINEIPSTDYTKVNIKLSIDSSNLEKNFKIFDTYVYDYFYINEETSEINLLDTFDEYDKIEISIITPNKENIIIK